MKLSNTAQLKHNTLVCALPTPFLPETYSIDFTALKKVIAALIDASVDGLLAVGSTGEVHSLSINEQMQVIEKVASFAAEYTPSEQKRPKIWAGLFATHLLPAIQHMQRIESLNVVDALLIITPYYIKPSQKELIYYYTTLADKSSIPLYLYNNPGRTGVTLALDTITHLAKHPNIIGIKESALTLERIQMLGKIPNFEFFCGNDDQIPLSIANGAKGAISALLPLAPQAFRVLCSLPYREQQTPLNARALAKLLDKLVSYANPQLLKTLGAEMGLMHPTLRPPLLPYNLLEEKAIKALLNDLLQL